MFIVISIISLAIFIFISRGILERVRTKFRIHLNVATMVASCFGFAYYSWAGKQAVKEGRGIHAVNKDWHKEIDASTDANTTQLPSIKKGI